MYSISLSHLSEIFSSQCKVMHFIVLGHLREIFSSLQLNEQSKTLHFKNISGFSLTIT